MNALQVWTVKNFPDFVKLYMERYGFLHAGEREKKEVLKP